MKTFSTRVLEISEVAENTLAVKLEKPVDFSFVAGQYSVLAVPKLVEDDSRGVNRCMSIASAPYEDHLLFAMRISESGYKKTIAALSPGDEMLVGAPIGQFTLLSGDQRPIVFLVGGIGITPARSILRQANHDSNTREFFLFYSNYRPEDTPFLDELKTFPNISYHPIFTMTETDRSVCVWDADRGFICDEMIAKHLPNVKAPIYYLVGTPSFTKAMEVLLAGYGIEKDAIKQDPFVGL
ncbi:MAG: FAD-dependent oxidoreductase [Candidatus Moraniibacteriota bacterium]|nr:MAG: FAD-dependent oxidoreductase [Candidatus Moranbacteria bacterium]